LGRLYNWGWIKSDFDEKLNTYVIEFPQYSHDLLLRLYKQAGCGIMTRMGMRQKLSGRIKVATYSNFFRFRQAHNDIPEKLRCIR